MATIGNIIALIYIQSKRLNNFNSKHERMETTKSNDLNLKKIEEPLF
jgi:hypothetical protein